MKEDQLLDFSLQYNPAAMVGYVHFCLLMIVAKSHFRSVYERMYAEFQHNILYRPGIIDPEDQLVFVLFGENTFQVDSALARVDSFEGVKTADAFIVTGLQYYDDWIMKEIDRRLPRKSIVADALKAQR